MKGGDPMYNIEHIIAAGKSGDFEPRDYLNTAEADKAIMALEKAGKAQTVDDIITYFQGFARGLEEAEKGTQG